MRGSIRALLATAAVLMAAPVLVAAPILLAAPIILAAPAWAQTYGPDHPVCLQTYGIDGNYIDCSFASLPQCAQSASGRAAQCIVNPYFRTAQAPMGHDRQRRRVY